MKIQVDPNTDAGGFGYADAGQHRLRVKKAEFMKAKSAEKHPGLQWTFEFADPNTPSAEKNKDGSNKKLGNVFEYTTLKKGDNAQFRLRQLCDAVGIRWNNELDTDNFTALEFEANVSIEEFEGAFRNKVKRFIPAG